MRRWSNIVPQSTYEALDRGIPPFQINGKKSKQLNTMTQTSTTHPSTQDPDEPEGGVASTLELLLEIRQARALLQSQITELKKRTKVKVQKLNMAEANLLDSYEEHDRQLTLFHLPPVPEDVRAILDDPRL